MRETALLVQTVLERWFIVLDPVLVAAYAPPTPCPVLTSRGPVRTLSRLLPRGMSGTEIACGIAMSGTEIACGTTMSSTEIAYGTTMSSTEIACGAAWCP
eukprot:2746123-Rhodomonas_salina.1